MTRLVLIKKFTELTGYSADAVDKKIRTGVWREGHEYRKAPDGHILVDLEGYEKWVEGRKQAA